MKKIILTAVLAAAMCVAFAACGEEEAMQVQVTAGEETILEDGTNMKGGHSVIVEADSIEHKLVQGHHFLVEKYQNASILAYFFLPPP